MRGILSRRSFVAAAGCAAFAGRIGARPPAPRPLPARAATNPLVRQRADAHVFRHEDGLYYFTASVPEYDRLVLRRAARLEDLGTAEEVVVWRRPARGRLGGYIWAPELHWIDGRWHIYFAAGDKDDPFRIRTYVLSTPARDAFDPRWSLLGRLETPWDSFTLDSTSFVHRGTRYLCWAQREPGIDTNSNLYLAPLASPTRLARRPVRLTVPTLPWEVQGFKVNEAPAILARNGRLFLSYSASATDARYCLGLLTADADADIMRAGAWAKSPEPVFATSRLTGVYGPGHNSFTVDGQGRDLLVYHGRDYERISGDPLFDPNRHTRVQRLYYRADGTPDFGIPVGNGPLPDRLAPMDAPGARLAHAGDRLLVGAAALPATQFRQMPGGAGVGTVSLAPIDAAGMLVGVGADGAAALVRDDGARATALRTSFRREAGLADPRGASFRALTGAAYLRHAGGAVRLAPVAGDAARTAATFRLS